MDRRSFIEKICAISVFAGAPLWLRAQMANAGATLDEAFKQAGFNPKSKGCGYFVLFADPHYDSHPKGKQKWASEQMPKAIKEIKDFSTAPEFVITLGDLVSNGNPCFGSTIKKTDLMIKDFQMFKDHMEELAPIPYKVVAGNHDCTGPLDFEFKEFREFFKQSPYYAFDFHGMRCIALNGLHAGMLDEAQQKWFEEEFKKLKGQDVIILVHQPMGAVRSEWKISKSVRDQVDNYSGNVFIFAGHNHAHRVEVLKSPAGKLVPQVTVEAFRQKNAVTYWLCCVKDGKIVATIMRTPLGKFANIDVSKCKPKTWGLPWENMKDEPVKIYDIASPDYHEIARKGGGVGCVYFHFYLRELEGWLDTSSVENFSKLYLMGTTIQIKKRPEKNAKFWLSADGKDYVEFVPEKYKGLVFKVELPKNLRDVKKLYFKIKFGHSDGGFTGFALGK